MSKLFLQLDPFQVLIMEKPSMNPKPIERKKSNNKKIASTGCPSKFGGTEQYSKDHKSCEWGPNLPGHPVKKVFHFSCPKCKKVNIQVRGVIFW